MNFEKGLKERGVIVKVNTIVLPGINDEHVIDIAREMAKLEVDLFNCMPYYPNEGSNFSHLGEPSKKTITALQKEARRYIPQMLHCKRCRADAVGMLDEINPDIFLMHTLQECAEIKEIPKLKVASSSIPSAHIAVATREGVLVNQHLGEAIQLNIYDIGNDTPVLIEKRTMPEPGGMDFRWHTLADTIKDCHILLCSGAGDSPKRVLKVHGIEVMLVNGLIDELLSGIKNNLNINHLLKRDPFKCSQECSGAGMGCM